MWDLPRSGLELESPALALSTAPPGKSLLSCFLIYILATLGLRCCMQAFSSCSEGCLLSSCGAQASLIAETGSRFLTKITRADFTSPSLLDKYLEEKKKKI